MHLRRHLPAPQLLARRKRFLAAALCLPVALAAFLTTGVTALAAGPLSRPSVPCAVQTTVFGVLPDLRTVTLTRLTTDPDGTRRIGAVEVGSLPADGVALAALDESTLVVATADGALRQVTVSGPAAGRYAMTQAVLARHPGVAQLAFDGTHLYETVSGHLYRIALSRPQPVAASPAGGPLSPPVRLGPRQDLGRGFVLSTLTAVGPRTLLGTTARGEWIVYGIAETASGYATWTRQSLGTSPDPSLTPLPAVTGGLYLRGKGGAMTTLRGIDPLGLGDASRAKGGQTRPLTTPPLSKQSPGAGSVDSRGWTQALLSAAPASCAPAGQAGDANATNRAVGQWRTFNGFADGWCTEGAALLFEAASGYWMNIAGDAWAWASSARAAGWTVTTVPKPRSVVVFQPYASLGGGVSASQWGHVAWVDAVSSRSDGIWFHIQEMNGPGGRGVWDRRWVPYQAGFSEATAQPEMQFILAP